jgi:hypothetical protein
MFKEFFRSMFSRWLTALSGPLSVLPAFLSVYASSNFARIVYGGLALAGLLITSYGLWRNERLRVIELERSLDPKLTIQFIPGTSAFVTETTVNDSTFPPEFQRALFFRVMPQCNAQTNNCLGVLKGVKKLDGHEWIPTAYNEAQPLIWSNRLQDRTIRLDPGVPQYLDVFYIRERDNMIVIPLFGGLSPNNVGNVFKVGGIFRVDIAVVGDSNARAEISLKITTGASWREAVVEAIPA